jgi:predicted CXXCH cytochrome family protein
MPDLPTIPPQATRRRPGRLLALTLALFVGLALGCSHQRRYKVLSFFFDGVPDPSKPLVRATGDLENPSAFKGGIVSTHKPFAAGKCDACHAPMNADEVASVQTVIDSSVCMKCHEPELRRHAVMHAPVVAGACLFCHSPHNSTQPHLLVAAAPAVCTQCHDRSLLGANPPEHLSENSACLDCHVGHGEEKRGALLRAVRPKSSAPTTVPAGAKPWAPIDMPPENPPATQPAVIGAAAVHDGGSARIPQRAAGERPFFFNQFADRIDPTPSLIHPRPPEPVRPFFLEQAPPEGPVVIGELHRPSPIGMGPITPGLEFRYRYDHDSIAPRNGRSSSFTENRIEEDVTLSTTAYVIHPNLLDLKLDGTFGARQDWNGNSGRTLFSDESIYDYNVEGTFLRKEDVPVTLYSRRTEDVLNQQFGPSFDNINQSSGGFLEVHSAKWPTHVEAYHSDQDQTSFGGQESYHLSQNVFTATSSYEPSPNNRVAASYTYNNNYEQSKVQGFAPTSDAFDTHDASLSHTVTFGKEKRNDLSSSISYFGQTGNFGIERLSETEFLHLTHSDTFESRYSYSLNYQTTDSPSFGTTRLTENNFNTGFTHHLYESLITTGDAGTHYLDRSDHSGTFGYYGSIRLDYRKKVPLGLLTIDGGYTFDQQDNRAQSSVLHVVNETRTFSLTQPITLVGAAVVAQSIVVKDVRGLIIYIQGSDYLVRAFADRVELSLVIGGRITDGQTVLLDYELSAQPANRVTDNTYSGLIRYDFQRGALKNLGVYGRFFELDQRIDSSGSFHFFPNSVRDYAAGFDYRLGEFTVGGEYEWHASDIAPYNAARAYTRLQHRTGPRSTAGVELTYTDYDYYREPDRLTTLQASANLTQSITRELYATASGSYLNEHDRIAGTTNGYQATAELQWTHRQTRIYIQFRESVLKGPSQSTQFQSVWMGLRRSF